MMGTQRIRYVALKVSMQYFEIIKCHGSGNDFILVDAIGDGVARGVDREAFARVACDRQSGIGGDGILFIDRDSEGRCVMDMLNPDGTHAEMCGNGIRCVARVAMQRGYVTGGVICSGGRVYAVERAANLAAGVEAYTVDIPLRLWSADFAFFGSDDKHVGKIIEELHPELQFTALSPGNPHIVAAVESIDMELLESLGEKVKGIKSLFPNGVNISLYKRLSSDEIFVATYERGAGITLSCGTAMTSSATAAVLLGLIEEGTHLGVCNRGGKVFCTTRLVEGVPTTKLEGNATIVWRGKASFDGVKLCYDIEEHTNEDECWKSYVASLGN